MVSLLFLSLVNIFCVVGIGVDGGNQEVVGVIGETAVGRIGDVACRIRKHNLPRTAPRRTNSSPYAWLHGSAYPNHNTTFLNLQDAS